MKQARQQNLHSPLMWNSDALLAFECIKKELHVALMLATQDYTKPFHLYVANRTDDYASSLLSLTKTIMKTKTISEETFSELQLQCPTAIQTEQSGISENKTYFKCWVV